MRSGKNGGESNFNSARQRRVALGLAVIFQENANVDFNYFNFLSLALTPLGEICCRQGPGEGWVPRQFGAAPDLRMGVVTSTFKGTGGEGAQSQTHASHHRLVWFNKDRTWAFPSERLMPITLYRAAGRGREREKSEKDTQKKWSEGHYGCVYERMPVPELFSHVGIVWLSE